MLYIYICPWHNGRDPKCQMNTSLEFSFVIALLCFNFILIWFDLAFWVKQMCLLDSLFLFTWCCESKVICVNLTFSMGLLDNHGNIQAALHKDWTKGFKTKTKSINRKLNCFYCKWVESSKKYIMKCWNLIAVLFVSDFCLLQNYSCITCTNFTHTEIPCGTSKT